MATIKEVARKAGVSPSTVSLVLNGRESAVKISGKTKERVLRAAGELGYSPNVFAKSLRTKKSSAILILVFDIIDPFNACLMRGAEGHFASCGYHTFFCEVEHDESNLLKCLHNAQKRMFEGMLITANSVHIGTEIIQLIKERGIPTVAVGRRPDDESMPTVTIDNECGAYLAVKHLLDLGHKDIGVIAGPSQYVDSEERLEGARKAFRECGVELPDQNIVQEKQVGWSPFAGYESMKTLLARRKQNGISAVFTFDDVSAFGAVRAIYEHKLRVPEDISVVGFDDLPASAFYNPPLTTIHYGMTEIGFTGAKMLIELIRGSKGKIESFVTQSKLIVRKSTRPIRDDWYQK